MFRPRKRLGQNFLQDPNTARRIVDALDAPEGARVVEIGPGTGALTGLLLERWPELTAIEVDPRAVALLREAHPGLDVREADVLEADWEALAEGRTHALYVIGNLPYYITSPILFVLLDARTHLRRAVVMMQREVAERIVAEPRTKAYGILSVLVQLWARPTLAFRVSRNVFYPKPDVQSAVLRLDFGPEAPIASVDDPEWVRRVVRTAFNQRRKTLRNSLRSITAETGRSVPERWAGRRPEALPPEAFLDLAAELHAGRNM